MDTSTLQQGFAGARVVSFESRLASLMEENLKKYGAEPLSAPSMKEIPLHDHPEVFSFAEKLLRGQIHMLICMTGVGIKILYDVLANRYEPAKVVEALSALTIVARGPKPIRVLKELGIPVTISVPEPNTWREILEELEFNKKSIELSGKTVAIQEYGIPNEDFIRALKAKGAHLIQIPVYRWGLPDDTQPLATAIQEIVAGRVQFALFTSAHQVRNLLRLASEKGLEKDLIAAFQNVVVCSVGPTATEAILENGIKVDFEPSHPKMGHLISEAAKNSKQLREDKNQPVLPSVSLSVREIPKQEIDLRQESVFLKACRREPVPYTPVWLMRQAGRYMKEYQRIRDRVPFIDLCKNKELCAEITITAAEKIKADAAILFSDLLLIVEPMGMSLHYAKSEGPVITGQLETAADIDRLREVKPEESMAYVLEAIRLTRSSMNSALPLIGFAAAPFTLASYMIEGGSSRQFIRTKSWMYRDPGAWHALMDKIDRALIALLNAQIKAGVDAVQIFDSWVGCLGPEDYRQYVLPHSKKVIEALNRQVPVIHFGTGTGPFLKFFKQAGGDVIGVDYRVALDEAWKTLGYDVAIQGNLDPCVLFAELGTICEQAKRILDQAGGKPGHIFNLGHGVLPNTPVEHVLALVDFVHEISQKTGSSKK